jgi:1-acyl-sn-glycerol-3-phosphate acyltransferase
MDETFAPARLAALVADAVCHVGMYHLSARLKRKSSEECALALLQRWSRHACRLLRLDVHLHGAPSPEPCIYVSNHRSYLDIPLLAAVLRARFLSRADLAHWPLVGPAARAAGTVFVNRADVYARVRAARALARRVKTQSLVVFAEGTTHGAPLPEPFHAGIFRLLQRLNTCVVPVTIRYSDRRVYWTDDTTLGQHVRRRVLTGVPVKAAVHIGAALRPRSEANSEALQRRVYEAVCTPIQELGELVAT